jgi:CBS domain-containing membrane protein
MSRHPDPAGRRGLFVPILAGATGRDRLYASLAAAVAVALLGLVGALVHGDPLSAPWLAAPVAASAVLVFAVPASPLAQPWPVVGGNVLSAAVGLLVGHLIGDRAVAAGVAIGLAIAVMSLARCLHPPGGASAVVAALGGPGLLSAGDLFPVAPVGLGAVALVVLGWGYHRVSGHTYPHVAPTGVPGPGTTDPPPAARVGFRTEDIDAVLARVGDAFDIGRADLAVLLREVERQALVREHGDIACAEIMSRDVIAVTTGTAPDEARRLLLESGVRLLPVLDDGDRVAGEVGLRELARPGATVGDRMAPPLLTAPDRPAIALVEALTDGRRHAATVVDGDRRLLGLVTQTDLLAALSRELGRPTSA